MIRTRELIGALVMFAAVGCGSSSSSGEGTRTIQGSLTGAPAGTQAIAETRAGRAYYASLDASGAFSLRVPGGAAYRVLFATPAAGGHTVTGHLVTLTSGGKAAWLKPSANLVLGRIAPAAVPVAGGTQTQNVEPSEGAAESGSDDGSEAAEPAESEHEDDAKLCRGTATSGTADQELEAEKGAPDSDVDHAGSSGSQGENEDDHGDSDLADCK